MCLIRYSRPESQAATNANHLNEINLNLIISSSSFWENEAFSSQCYSFYTECYSFPQSSTFFHILLLSLHIALLFYPRVLLCNTECFSLNTRFYAFYTEKTFFTPSATLLHMHIAILCLRRVLLFLKCYYFYTMCQMFSQSATFCQCTSSITSFRERFTQCIVILTSMLINASAFAASLLLL